MPITIDGLNSGLDTESIVNGLLEIQQAQIDRLTTRKQASLNKQAAFETLEAQLVNFRSTAGRLGRTQNSVFESRTVSVSHESAIVASADSDATTGVYQVSVEALAQAHQVASQGFADSDAQITQGTFSLRQGSSPAVEITIDSTNNTLQGLADSINLAELGVTASIVNDGSSSGASARLLLASSKTGEDNAISITNGLAASAGGAVQPTFDFGNPVQAATNAQVKLGSGTGAFTVESSENRIEDLISGVTLDLLEADPGKPISINVKQDTETAVGAVQDFVDSYNALIDFIDNQTRYVSETDEAGLLIGDRSLIQIESEIQSALQTVIPGVSTSANRLSTVGVTIGDTGKLSLNAGRLEKALKGEIDDVRPDDLRRLFTLDATSTNPNIQFVLGSTRTLESTDPVQVDITQAAERASIQGGLAISASTIIDSSNNELTLTIDNAELTVTLAEGTYTEEELAAQLESVINAHPDTRGRSVSVGVQDQLPGPTKHLTVTSNIYGDGSQVTIQSGSALGALGFTGTENDQGVDVEGHFIVNGEIEEAVGNGRLLSGKADNANTADLQVRVTLAASQVVAGAEGDLTVSRGFAARLERLIGGMTDNETGVLKSIKDKFSQDADSVQESIDRQTALFEKQEQDLIAQFVNLERALGELESTSSFLTQQFASLNSLKTY